MLGSCGPITDSPYRTGGWISFGIIEEYEYKFAQLHLHWGDDFRGGSEHTMNGRRYFGEVHIVHYEDEYHNLGEALEDAKGDGVAVLGYFIDVRFVNDDQLVR